MKKLSDAAIRKLMTDRADLAARLRALDERIAEASRQYSADNGFRVVLRTEALANAVGYAR